MDKGMSKPPRRLMGLRAWLGLTAVGLLAACGGGGGGDDRGGGGGTTGLVNVPTAPAVITTTGVQDLVLAALDFGGTGLDAAPGAPQPFSAASSETVTAPGTTLQSITGYVTGQALGITPAYQPDAAMNCPDGGTHEITHAGATEVHIFNNCTNNPVGIVLNGRVEFSNLVSDPVTGNVSVDANYVMFSVRLSTGDTLLLHGDVSVSITNAADGSTRTITTVTQLRFQASSPGQPTIAFLLTDLNSQIDVDSVGNVTEQYTFTLASNIWNGAVTVETLSPVVTRSGDLYPSSGQVSVIGANNASCLITISDYKIVAKPVKVDVDIDGDGTPDVTQTYSWAELEG